MRRILTLLLPLLAAFALIPQARALQDRPALSPFAARQLAPGVHLLATPPEFLGPVISNITVIDQRDGFVVVDSGATIAHGRRVVDFIRSLSPRKPVKAVVITHWHNDHPSGVAAIREAWPRVRIIATPQTRAGLLGPAATSVGFRPDERFETSMLNQLSQSQAQIRARRADPSLTEEQRQRYDRMMRNFEEFGRGFAGTYLVLPTETFGDQLMIDDPERPVRLMFLGRANTAGDAIVWLPRQRIVATGDVVVAPTPFGFFSFPEDWIRTLERIKGLNFALLVPGHGEPMTDTAYIDRLTGTITDIRNQVGPLARQGLSLEEVRQRVDFAAQTDIFGTTPRLRLTFQSLWLEPMIENAYKEARGIPIVQGEGEVTVATQRSGSRR